MSFNDPREELYTTTTLVLGMEVPFAMSSAFQLEVVSKRLLRVANELQASQLIYYLTRINHTSSQLLPGFFRYPIIQPKVISVVV